MSPCRYAQQDRARWLLAGIISSPSYKRAKNYGDIFALRVFVGSSLVVHAEKHMNKNIEMALRYAHYGTDKPSPVRLNKG
jgi:hypothetical protein